MKELLVNIKIFSEILALIGAAVFFSYKFISGYFFVNLGISAKVERSKATQTHDYLTVAATLKKGSLGSINVHDVRARFSYDEANEEIELIGFNRLSYKTDNDEIKRKRVNFKKESQSNPILRLTTDEETTFSGISQIPTNKPCKVEVVVIGIRDGGKKVCQWRTSVISLPIGQNDLANRLHYS